MFADFENMIKEKLGSLKTSTKASDITRTPQRYRIKDRSIQQLKLLSEGSFGFIWLAEDANTKQKFALKRIVCITNERFLLAKNQLELMMKFPKSKNIVECFGGELVTLKNGSVENKVFIILMEYCPNGTLFDLLSSRENKGFSEKELLQIAYSILQGLKNIHKIGCYHQDVKIQNVLVGQDKAFKLCDFGSCSNRFIDFKTISKSEYGHIKEEIEAMTTPMYRPPEIVDPYLQYEVNYKVDVWMLGCVIYTLAFFTHPFVDSNAVGIAGGVYRFPKHPEQTQYQVSEKIKDFIRNLLTPNPAFRPSVQDAMMIINNWYTLSEIPLNIQAARRKQEELRKEKEMEPLNRKVVDIDGDIPIEKLMELQQKLKNKSTTEEAQTKSFISKKNTLPTNNLNNQTKPLFSTHSMPSYSPSHDGDFFNFKPAQKPNEQASKQKQDTVSSNLFWNTGAASKPASFEVKRGNSGEMNPKSDAFSDFFSGSSTKPAEQTNKSNDIYDYFFTKEETKAQSSGMTNKKSNETNLLDL